MMKMMYKLGTAAASGGMLLSAFAPLASAGNLSVEMTGNGAFSNNTASVTQSSTTAVTQNNNANINTTVTSNANSGGNSAAFNTGGDVTIGTGAATNQTVVTNAVNSNAANVAPCGGCDGHTNLKISGNGAVSDNSIDVNRNSTTVVNQNNNANVDTRVDSNANSGRNRADFTTGGDVRIGTGPATTSVDVRTRANQNVATVGGNGGNAGGLSVDVSGNGAFSDGSVDVDLDNVVVLTQNNNADIDTDVDADANSGGNSAFANTGGDVVIGTGPARARAVVDNAVNFNWANVEACCVPGNVAVKIAGNGAGGFGLGYGLFGGSATNDVTLDLSNDHIVAQNNNADLDTDVDANAKSGRNSVDFSVGPVGSDPSILTGAAEDVTMVSNSGNSNTYGSTTLPSPFPFPTSSTGSSTNVLWMLWSHFMGM